MTSKLKQTMIPKFNHLQIMDLLLRVEAALAGRENLIKISIMQAIRDQVPAKEILRTIQDMTADNYNMVADLLGNTLTTKIKNFEL